MILNYKTKSIVGPYSIFASVRVVLIVVDLICFLYTFEIVFTVIGIVVDNHTLDSVRMDSIKGVDAI